MTFLIKKQKIFSKIEENIWQKLGRADQLDVQTKRGDEREELSSSKPAIHGRPGGSSSAAPPPLPGAASVGEIFKRTRAVSELTTAKRKLSVHYFGSYYLRADQQTKGLVAA